MNSSFCQCCLTPYVYVRGLARDVDEQLFLSVRSPYVYARGLARDVDEQLFLSVRSPYVYARGLARDVDEQLFLSVRSPYVYARGLARDVKRILPSLHYARGLARDVKELYLLSRIVVIFLILHYYYNLLYCNFYYECITTAKRVIKTLKKCTETSNKKIFYKNQEEVGMTKL